MARKRTAKACGPDAPTLASSRWKQFCRRRRQPSPVTGESTKETVKTIARGMPGVSGVTVVTNARVYYTPRAAAGASSARHSLRPLIDEGRDFVTTRADIRRGDGRACFLDTSILRDARLRRAPPDEVGSRGSKERSQSTRLETLMVR